MQNQALLSVEDEEGAFKGQILPYVLGELTFFK